jgi:hypothetical protein
MTPPCRSSQQKVVHTGPQRDPSPGIAELAELDCSNSVPENRLENALELPSGRTRQHKVFRHPTASMFSGVASVNTQLP